MKNPFILLNYSLLFSFLTLGKKGSKIKKKKKNNEKEDVRKLVVAS